MESIRCWAVVVGLDFEKVATRSEYHQRYNYGEPVYHYQPVGQCKQKLPEVATILLSAIRS